MLPSDIANRALDSIGVAKQIGAFTDGTDESEAFRRVYGQTLRQLLRTANWGFARKLDTLQLLGDSTGQTADPINGGFLPTTVEPPWIYAYAWPIDGVRARWMPQQINPPTTSPPPTTGTTPNNPWTGWQMPPARFLISSSDQFPVVIGQTDWDDLPDLNGTEGVGQISRRIVLTNVQNAYLVYTKLVLEIEEWDELFTEGMVATLASRVAMILIEDKKHAMAMRAQQVQIAQAAVREARTVNANDAGFPQSVVREASWIRARTGGGPWRDNQWDNNLGYWSMGWESCSWADGSVY